MINLHLSSKLFTPYSRKKIFDYSHRFEVWKGSAGSGKSYSIAQKIIIRCCSEQIKVLVCRKYGTTIRNTVFALFKEILTKWKIAQYCKIRESDFTIVFPNGSSIIFLGLDEETKLLSLQNIGTIWIEEAYEVEKDLVDQLNLRMRSNVKDQQIIMSFNPISQDHWLYEFCEVEPPESFVLYESTYKDNPFLPKEYVETLEEMRVRNPQKARVFCDGQWGIDEDGLVLKNWVVEEFDEMELSKSGLPVRIGCDLGWTDPSAVVESIYDSANHVIYVFDEYYQSGAQLSDIVTAMRELGIRKQLVYVDSAEPRSIEYFRSEGINAVGSKKGRDSVKNGFMFLQNCKIVVHPRCENFLKEISNLSYIKSKKTGRFTEDMTHEWSHSIDALRYAYSDIYTNNKLSSIDKHSLGL